MNDDLRITDEELRRATARRLVESERVDGETAALRDGFLALGAGLEELTSRGDEEALAAELKRWSRTAEAGAPDSDRTWTGQ